MGYSSRYHAASLAAVFLALGIGILIGVGFGDNVVTGTAKNLEESLKGDLADERGESAKFRQELNREHEFGRDAYPALVADRLTGRRIGLIAIGGLPRDLSRDIEQALEPTGARLAQVSVVRAPPDADALASKFDGTRFAGVAKNDDLLEELAKRAGTELVLGGRIANESRKQLLARASGRFGGLDAVVVVRDVPEDADLDPDERERLDRLESGLLEGIRDSEVPAVAVERTEDDPSQIGFFSSRQYSTVDDLDLTAGRVALVLALAGAEGNFGVKGTADRLLPETIESSSP